MSVGVLLYGPPASGKDTITERLTKLDPRYELFARLKAGPGRTHGYRMASEDHIEALRQQGGIIWENRRYNSVYIVDRLYLIERLKHSIPIIHLGQVKAIDAVRQAIPTSQWVVVSLQCPRDIAEARIIARATGDVDARLRAWAETKNLDTADLTLDTATVDPDTAAISIHRIVNQRQGERPWPHGTAPSGKTSPEYDDSAI